MRRIPTHEAPRMTLLYDAAYLAVAVLSLGAFIGRLSQAESWRELLRQRLGILPAALRNELAGKKVIWLHAVSVGEVIAVENFMRRLLRERPGYHAVLTTVTPTGQRVAKKLEGPDVSVCYFPFDFSFAVRRFFRALQPECLLLAETEIWPNLITEAARLQVPAGILNARLSRRSARRYARFKMLFRPLFERLQFVLAQTEDDAERFRACGTDSSRVVVLGNMKFDNMSLEQGGADRGQSLRDRWGFAAEDRILIAGSTHRGEESLVVKAFLKLQRKEPRLRLVLAPRHPERAQETAQLVLREGLDYRMSSNGAGGEKKGAVVILDELGVLRELYALADAVFVGGSLVPGRGGQNPIEPAVFRKAIVHGPHVFNFERVYQALDGAGGALRVYNGPELEQALETILGNASENERLGRLAYQTVVSLRGATEKHVRWMADFLASEKELVKG